MGQKNARLLWEMSRLNHPGVTVNYAGRATTVPTHVETARSKAHTRIMTNSMSDSTTERLLCYRENSLGLRAIRCDQRMTARLLHPLIQRTIVGALIDIPTRKLIQTSTSSSYTCSIKRRPPDSPEE